MTLAWREVHRIAAAEAARAHRDLGLDTGRRIDPFAALQAAGVVVLRRRVDRFAGLYLPADPRLGSPPGVLVNLAHPWSKQRFTAAHELCHHRRDGAAVLDLETEWIARGEDGRSDRERTAEAFAAWFLMPAPLVQRSLEALGLRAATLDPPGAYALALELGASYAATVRRLADLRLIDEALRDRLLRVTPWAIKRALGGLDAAASARRNVWVVRPAQAARPIWPCAGDAVVVEVPEAPSSGYLWQVAQLSSGLALVREEYRPDHGDALGGRGTHRFLFRVDAAGRREVRLELRRPWQPGAPAESFRVDVAAEPAPGPGIVDPAALLAG